ncbi:unnamed protein product [Cuscuta epithymum]|uniref:Zinc finger PHD-type domain-containing protein n=1 Tax=Cuscuta epithymum TaxID=186058 RepID=A0AAV0DS28_9ASTE|nr:unnamed protein product [Cuscuta epithymum]
MVPFKMRCGSSTDESPKCHACGRMPGLFWLIPCFQCKNLNHFYCMNPLNKKRFTGRYLCNECQEWIDAGPEIPRRSSRVITLNQKYFNEKMCVGMSFGWLNMA